MWQIPDICKKNEIERMRVCIFYVQRLSTWFFDILFTNLAYAASVFK